MKTSSMLRTRSVAVLSAAVLMLAVALPTFLGVSRVYAGQVTERSVRITSSQVGQAGVTYNFSFKPSTITGDGADDIKGIVIQFCQNSPLLGVACTTTNGVSATPADAASVTVTSGSGVVFTVDGASNQADLTVLTSAAGIVAPATVTPITFAFTATNPSGTSAQASDYGTFYARILTYNTTAGAAAYTDIAPGTHLDDGGAALSTAKQLTLSGRVQEQLEFCVAALDGTIDTNGEVPANCSAAPFANATATTAVDLGIVDSGVATISPIAAGSGGNDKNGGVLIRTNAFNGAVISYFAEQNAASGRLKVPGAVCSGTSAFDATSSEVDQCFNSSVVQTSFAGAGEKFGMTAQKYFNGTTDNLTRDAAYDGNGTAVGGFAWDSSGTNNPATTLATATTVLDYELLILRFAARAAATTPTGAYTVTSTYIATATF